VRGGEGPDLDRQAEAFQRDGVLERVEGALIEDGPVAEKGVAVDLGQGDVLEGVHRRLLFSRARVREER
jgi:hypothetical protein